ncbi:MAG: ThuA domain-containing protein [Capsulimonadaceae bacterium]|nr:ThuA domain-containing protein [Capsulimonadaceae bacterium]
MNTRTALIVWGGWDGHEPKQIAEIFNRELSNRGFSVTVSDSLDAFKDCPDLKSFDLIVPVWTMGEISGEQLNPMLDAVKSGVGIAGCHGGMCDSFRAQTEYQFMTGGQWVAHPGNDGTEYVVRITDPNHFITQGAPIEFKVKSEQYYMHVDPSNKVLATTPFPVADGPHIGNGAFEMPVIWTRYYGKGRVAYNSLGHHADIVAQAEILPLMVRGLLWAAHAEDAA